MLKSFGLRLTMVNSDQFRSQEAVRVFAQMAPEEGGVRVASGLSAEK